MYSYQGTILYFNCISVYVKVLENRVTQIIKTNYGQQGYECRRLVIPENGYIIGKRDCIQVL